jgi:hypothetical protein
MDDRSRPALALVQITGHSRVARILAVDIKTSRAQLLRLQEDCLEGKDEIKPRQPTGVRGKSPCCQNEGCTSVNLASATDGLFRSRLRFVGSIRPHIRAPLELERICRADSEEARPKANRRQGAGVNLLVNLLASDKPVLGKFRYGHVRLRMGFEILKRHSCPGLGLRIFPPAAIIRSSTRQAV